MAEMKTEDGIQFPAEAYAYVPDKEKPSTWKLRLWKTPDGGIDRKQVGMAIAAFSPGGFRGQQVEIPDKDISKVKDKIREAWKKVNPDKSEDMMPDYIKKESLIDQIKSILKDLGIIKEENKEIEKSEENKETEEIEKSEENKIEELKKEIGEEIRKEEASKREQLEKQLEELRKEKEEEEIKKKEAEEVIKKQEYITKAENYNNLPIETEKLGLFLKEASEKLDSESIELIESLFKSTNEILKNSELFKEVGSNTTKIVDTNTKIEQLVQKKVSEKGINKHKAYTEVLLENPDIAREIL